MSKTLYNGKTKQEEVSIVFSDLSGVELIHQLQCQLVEAREDVDRLAEALEKLGKGVENCFKLGAGIDAQGFIDIINAALSSHKERKDKK